MRHMFQLLISNCQYSCPTLHCKSRDLAQTAVARSVGSIIASMALRTTQKYNYLIADLEF